MNAKRAGILSALLTSIRCLGPFLLIAIGLGGNAAYAGRYHWFFLIGGMLVLAWAWTKYLREKTLGAGQPGPVERRRSGRLTLLLASAVVLGFGGLNISRYVLASSPATMKKESTSEGSKRVVIPVEGMSCAACEIALRHALNGIEGVKKAEVSVASATATVEYEPLKTNPAKLATAINSTGYRAALSSQKDESKSVQSPPRPNEVRSVNADGISFYAVPLRCPLVAGLGCGSAAKPRMEELERDPAVAEVWLNHAGTILAISWESGLDGAVKARAMRAAAEDNPAVNELSKAAREAALRDFQSGAKWYRPGEVDQLSSEEAAAVATRLVNRVAAKVPLAPKNSDALRTGLAEAFERTFVKGELSDEQLYDELLKTGRDQLDAKGMVALQEAVSQGWQAATSER